MKKALVFKKDGGLIECEYDQELIENILFSWEYRKIVNIGRKSFPCDSIEMIEWID